DRVLPPNSIDARGARREPQRPPDRRAGTPIPAHGERASKPHTRSRSARGSDGDVAARSEWSVGDRGRASCRGVGIRGCGGDGAGRARVRSARGRRPPRTGGNGGRTRRQEAPAIYSSGGINTLLPEHRRPPASNISVRVRGGSRLRLRARVLSASYAAAGKS